MWILLWIMNLDNSCKLLYKKFFPVIHNKVNIDLYQELKIRKYNFSHLFKFIHRLKYHLMQIYINKIKNLCIFNHNSHNQNKKSQLFLSFQVVTLVNNAKKSLNIKIKDSKWCSIAQIEIVFFIRTKPNKIL